MERPVGMEDSNLSLAVQKTLELDQTVTIILVEVLIHFIFSPCSQIHKFQYITNSDWTSHYVLKNLLHDRTNCSAAFMALLLLIVRWRKIMCMFRIYFIK